MRNGKKWKYFPLCALVLAAATFVTAGAVLLPTTSNNVGKQKYSWNWSQPVTSYLYHNGNGLTRVECIDDHVLVEAYDNEFNVTSSRSLDMDLPLWGGFYAGKEYNFMITGQKNPQESDSVEVIRVVKYDKDWNRLEQAGLFGGNTYIPFDAGSLRCTEDDGLLYIHTCHEMYKTSDGLHHQANLTMIVDENAMEVSNAFYGISSAGSSFGYTSHSFNQFILTDAEGNIVTLDHGDAYPRAISLMRFDGEGKKNGSNGKMVMIRKFPGEIGDNHTGAEIGGFSEITSGYVTAYRYITGSGNNTEKKILFAYVPKDLSAAKEVEISTGEDVFTPMLAPASLDGGYILWNTEDPNTLQASDSLSYAAYNADGKVSSVKEGKGLLSDCQPIPYQDGVIWYATKGTGPVFYILNDSGLKEIQTGDKLADSFTDIPQDAWYAKYINAVMKSGLMQGVDETHFSPEGTLTLGQVVTLAARLHMPKSVPIDAAPSEKWYMGAYRYCQKYSLLDTEKYPVGSMERYATRFEMVDILNRIFRLRTTVQVNPDGSISFNTGDGDAFLAKYYGITTLDVFQSVTDYALYFNLDTEHINSMNEISDVDSRNANFWAVLSWYKMGILTGDSNHRFNGDTTINRAETAAILCRMLGLTERIKL